METKEQVSLNAADLESHLGYWLRRVSNAVSWGFSGSLRAKNTSVAEWVLLCELQGRGQATPSELAGALGVTRGALSKVIDKLEEKSWIRMDFREGDGRYRLLTLTREGRRSLPALAAIADLNDAHFFDCLSVREKRTLRQILSKVAVHHGMHDVPTE